MHLSKTSITRMIAETAGKDVDNLDAKNKMIPKANGPQPFALCRPAGWGECAHSQLYFWLLCPPLTQTELHVPVGVPTARANEAACLSCCLCSPVPNRPWPGPSCPKGDPFLFRLPMLTAGICNFSCILFKQTHVSVCRSLFPQDVTVHPS